jgi:hypothetical protein
MKFHIEIVRDNGESGHYVYCTTVDEMSPDRARTKAAELLNLYAGRGATGARVSNDKDEELYRL